MGTIENGKIHFGAEVTPDIQKVLARCPDPDGIIKNIDTFNQEISESHNGHLLQKADADREAQITIDEARKKLGIVAKEVKAAKKEKEPVRRVKRNLSRPKQPVTNKPAMIKQPKAVEVKVSEVQNTIEMQNTTQDTTTVEEHMPSDFDTEMQELDKKIEDKVAEAAQEQQGLSRNRVMEALGKLKDAPSEVLIRKWKQELGEDSVHVTVFSEKEIYIYKHLTRVQWQKVQDMISKMQQAKTDVSEDELKEKVVSHCILWPSLTLEWKYNSRAGVLNALYDAVMLQSYFLSPGQVMALTTEL